MNRILLLAIGVAVVLVVLLIIFRKRILMWVIALVVVAGGLYAYKEYTRTNKDLSDIKPEIVLPANELIAAYEKNDSIANTKYLGKIIETNGNVKNVEKDDGGYYTIVLADTTSISSVRCAVDSLHSADAAHLAVGSSAVVRGACTGFNKDEMGLGSDVILNRCIIVQNKK